MADKYFIKFDESPPSENKTSHLRGIILIFMILVICFSGCTYLFLFTHSSGLSVPVVEPVRDIPPYHVINGSDITAGYVPRLYLTGNLTQNISSVIGKYSMVEISQGQPISLDMLGNLSPLSNLTDTVRIGVSLPDDAVTLCNDSLGEPVDLYLVNDTGNQMPVIFDNVTVLDVNGFAVDNNSEQYDAIIALPDADITQYMDSISTSNVEIVKNA